MPLAIHFAMAIIWLCNFLLSKQDFIIKQKKDDYLIRSRIQPDFLLYFFKPPIDDDLAIQQNCLKHLSQSNWYHQIFYDKLVRMTFCDD